MRNKKLVAISAIAISASVLFTGCSFGGDEPENSVTVSVTPTEAPPTVTPEPTAVPTIAPNVQSTTYTSADKMIAVNLPDATWTSKTDQADMYSFESPEVGNILILHGQGEDTMAATVIPSTQDMAVSLEQADGDKVNGTDFELQEYTSNDVNGIGVYSYTTKLLNSEKSNGNLYVVHKVFANDTEYYNIEADVKTEEALNVVKAAVESFQILGDSSLKEAAPQQEPVVGQTPADAGDGAADNNGDAAADTADTTTDAPAADTTDNGAESSSADASTSGEAAAYIGYSLDQFIGVYGMPTEYNPAYDADGNEVGGYYTYDSFSVTTNFSDYSYETVTSVDYY